MLKLAYVEGWTEFPFLCFRQSAVSLSTWGEVAASERDVDKVIADHALLKFPALLLLGLTDDLVNHGAFDLAKVVSWVSLAV